MTTRSKRRAPPKPRITVPLTGTVRELEAHLSADADLALAYAHAFLLRGGRRKVPAAGIVRAALVAYAGHLHEVEPAYAFRLVERACQASEPDSKERQAAELRLYSAPFDEPLPPFADIRSSPQVRQAMADLTARAEALAETVLAQTAWRRKALTKSPDEIQHTRPGAGCISSPDTNEPQP